jgi:epoxyqueuosine reductase
MISPADLSSRIRDEAARLGFCGAGYVQARPLPSAANYRQWISSGLHGSMAYLKRQEEKRCNPALVLDDARSLVVLAMNYSAGFSLSEDPACGKISRYAWGEDYHSIVGERLAAMEIYLHDAIPGVRILSYADTGPVMEKVWGAQGALGWMGKHTNLISRSRGSWIFLAVILLDVELEYDLPHRDFCGSCSRCIHACPTGAIIAPYVLDARLCISYLTIEHRGIIPRPLRALIGNRIFGCDDCQEACPWNRFARTGGESGFRPRPENLNPQLAPLVGLSNDEFNRRFRGSPVRRAKRDGFVRNVVVALGNSGDEASVPPLEQALWDESPVVRAHAVWALARIGSAEAIELLRGRKEVEEDPVVLEEFACTDSNPGLAP